MTNITINNQSFFEGLEDLIAQGKSVQFRLKGRSMQPFILDGCKITVAPIKFEDATMGDVVLARWRTGWILHRVLFKNKNYLFLVGDGNLAQIEKVNKDDLIAILTTYEGKDGIAYKVTTTSKFLSAGWFAFRPFRRLFHKLKSTTSR